MINVWAWPIGGPTDCRFCGGVGVVGLRDRWDVYVRWRAGVGDSDEYNPYCKGCEAGEVARKRTRCRKCGCEGAQVGPLGLDCSDPFFCLDCGHDRSLALKESVARSLGVDEDCKAEVYKWEVLPCVRCGKRGLNGSPEPLCGCTVYHLPEITGRVYFWEVGGFTKIGFTKRSTSERLRELTTGSTHQGRLVHEIEGCAADERFFHLYYRNQRVRGEWFDLRLCNAHGQPQPELLKRCTFCGGWCPMHGWDHCPASEAAANEALDAPFRTVELAQ